MKYLLQNDDMVLLQVKQDYQTTTTSVVSYDTNNSHLGNSQTTTIGVSTSSGTAFDPRTTFAASEAAGRMYNTNTDTIAVLHAIDDYNPAWQITLFDPQTRSANTTRLNTSFRPYGTIFTQIVMGDFNGDGLADPLVFYLCLFNNSTQWGMKVLTAADPKTTGSLTEGPEFYGNSEPLPLAAGSRVIAVGDFNGDGRDEIAMLLADHQNIAFYQVDPKTLQISPVPDPSNNNQPLTVKLTGLNGAAVTMLSNRVTLVAGRFRQCGATGNPCSPNGINNADLVVFGQIYSISGVHTGGCSNDVPCGYSVIPIQITPNYNNNGAPSGTFTAQVVPQSSPSPETPFFRFPDYHGASGALAQAAPLVNWPQQTNEQLVLGIRTNDGASYIEIGTFVNDGTLDQFDWESETEREFDAAYTQLQNLWVGNFDNQDSGAHSSKLQIETYEVVAYDFGLFLTPHINIFDVNAPMPFHVPVDHRTNWLKQVSGYDSGVPLGPGMDFTSITNDPPGQNFLVPADIQGRSLRLGSPTIVRVTSQIQPDVVLAMPPMHADWIKPYGVNPPYAPSFQNCTDSNDPCLVNVSVLPSVEPSYGKPFATLFNFDSGTKSSAVQSSTTSWGVSVKVSEGASFSFNDGLENASGSFTNTTKTAHDETVKKAYDTYSGWSNSLNVTTGFSDYLRWTQKDVNVYYYPVLGCGSNNADCPDNRTYVEFSVPDHVQYWLGDSAKQEWYQPVHEPGNLLSYPWSKSQLEKRFTDSLDSLSSINPPWASFGTSESSFNTTWSKSSVQSQTSGSTSSFSDEISMSYSEGMGVGGIDSADINFNTDINAHTSLDTLNESTLSLSSSSGVTLNIPGFEDTSGCCSYGFSQYIFGLENKNYTPGENACGAAKQGVAKSCIPVTDPDQGQQVAVATIGPLFTAYVADPYEPANGNNAAWWQNVYTKPDVALNHPERWKWNKATRTVSLNQPDFSGNTSPVQQQFYHMKGFFISKAPLTLNSGPNLAMAGASDDLTLTTRVYNYSLVDTTAPVHVRFYGQLYCSSSDNNHENQEASCRDWKTGQECNAGNLCGDSFQIGQDQIIPFIAGFNDNGNSDMPNWQTTSVDFQPVKFPATKNGNVHMVFWVVVWMQDNSGNLVAEMQDHGLTTIPDPGVTQITQVHVENYSNNVGMYPVHAPFFITPAGMLSGAIQGGGALQSIAITADPHVQLEQNTKIEASLQATGAPVKSVNIAYYDGDPAHNGTLLDTQKIVYMDPGRNYYHWTSFAPDTCGIHTLYAKAWTANSPAVQASTITSVTLDAVGFTQTLITATQGAKISDTSLRNTLLSLLNSALQFFEQGNAQAGDNALGLYLQQVSSTNGITPASASRLSGQASVLLGCGPSGFSLSALPSSFTVTAGLPASYPLAITPIGGFNGAVALSCVGLPAGAECSFTSPQVTLDGTTQSRVTLTITTISRSASAAGIMTGPPLSGRGKWTWFLMLFISALAIAELHRGR
ncbi:MAG TPA: VCBS repeat-containing protein, partial [Pseudacidobacterium sp.]|nr:VCBS repeat-containing protein [Pseudacidobacterium sp.]